MGEAYDDALKNKTLFFLLLTSLVRDEDRMIFLRLVLEGKACLPPTHPPTHPFVNARDSSLPPLSPYLPTHSQPTVAHFKRLVLLFLPNPPTSPPTHFLQVSTPTTKQKRVELVEIFSPPPPSLSPHSPTHSQPTVAHMNRLLFLYPTHPPNHFFLGLYTHDQQKRVELVKIFNARGLVHLYIVSRKAFRLEEEYGGGCGQVGKPSTHPPTHPPTHLFLLHLAMDR